MDNGNQGLGGHDTVGSGAPRVGALDQYGYDMLGVGNIPCDTLCWALGLWSYRDVGHSILGRFWEVHTARIQTTCIFHDSYL